MKTLLCVVLLGISGLLVQTALGCTCIKTDTSESGVKDPVKARENLRRYYLNEFRGALFTGTVISREQVSRVIDQDYSIKENKVTVRVDKYWLGITDPITVIFTGLGGGDCGVYFEVGKQYLFEPQLIDGKLRSGHCEYDTEDSKLPNGKAAAELEEVLGKPKRFSQKPKN